MSDLNRAVRVNEEIKRIVDVSRRINIVALNALLTARRAGARSLGFAVVSRELRAFAARLETAMAGLDDVISRLAVSLAEGLKEKRLLAYIEATVADTAHPSLLDTYMKVIEKSHRAAAAVDDDWRSLGRSIGSALRLSGTGLALARGARIEAAYGADMTPVLSLVATQVEAANAEIVDRLKAIRDMTASREKDGA